jgi:hypothetical protein
MGLIELLGFCISIFGMYCVVLCLRFLLPCSIITNVSSILNNAEQSLAHGVATGAIPLMNDYRVDLEMYTSCFCDYMSSSSLTHSHSLASQFSRMRIESHRSPGFFPQIRLAVRHGLTCRLYSLASQIGAVGQKVEVRWATLRGYPMTD